MFRLLPTLRCWHWLAKAWRYLATGSILVIVATVGCRTQPKKHEFSREQLGTTVRVVTYAHSGEAAERAAAAAFRRVDELERVFSEYDGDSELSRLNATAARNGREASVSPELWSLLETGQRVASATSGAFDMTVGPFVQLWRRAKRQARLPAPHRVAAASAAVGREKLLILPPDRVRFDVPDMRLACGGIAKGFIADAALAVMSEHGLAASLIDAGGDIVVGDPPPSSDGWAIAIDGATSNARDRVCVAHCAIATSGDREQFIRIGGERYSHVIDPRAGRDGRGLGSTDRRSATVLARSGAVADALASALVVLGAEHAAAALSHFPGASAQVLQLGDSSQESAPAVRIWRSSTLPVICPDPEQPRD